MQLLRRLGGLLNNEGELLRKNLTFETVGISGEGSNSEPKYIVKFYFRYAFQSNPLHCGLSIEGELF